MGPPESAYMSGLQTRYHLSCADLEWHCNDKKLIHIMSIDITALMLVLSCCICKVGDILQFWRQ